MQCQLYPKTKVLIVNDASLGLRVRYIPYWAEEASQLTEATVLGTILFSQVNLRLLVCLLKVVNFDTDTNLQIGGDSL